MSDVGQITDPADMLAFVYGGRAVFTLVSQKTNKRYTYRGTKGRATQFSASPPYFFNVLTGPDNTSHYEYIGFSRADWHTTGLRPGNKGNANHPAYAALNWFLGQVKKDRQPPQMEFWHVGKCARCARQLTDPVSIARGLGPECAGKV